ncbi:MAG: PLDc N-terminal domain-containing protein [Sphingobacteriales bacterium]|mgnify:CR=1 FL=1|nr:PLDc N-terminal domain-containing protein [Sphingobacteriales bacterium]OJY92357.1 MAG: hypothetical protein BGP14_14230 [Sphingobacteriales bacterium 44-15]
MSGTAKIVLGIISILPLCFLAIYFFFFISFFFTSMGHGMQQPPELNQAFPENFMSNMVWLFLLIILTALLSLGLLIYYIVHVVNNNRIDSTERIIWVLVFVLAGMVGFPVYWYMRIWKQRPVPPAQS